MHKMHAETGCVNALLFGITHKLYSKLKDKATMTRQIQKMSIFILTVLALVN